MKLIPQGLKSFYSINEFVRLGFMLGVICALFYPDFGALRTMSYVLGVFLSIAFITHIVRKYCLFNYINMGTLVKSALEQRNVAAAIVFAAICGVIVACIITCAQFFTR